jgi:DNA (cytosine-5)-methyltransferase 1
VRYLSVCSGIEAASVAWESLGWTPVAFSEIEKFPSKVLAHRFPNVPNFGDMTRYKEWDIARGSIDLLVGGTPCQAFSVAGLRKGLDDPRGNLALTFIAMVELFKPEWVVWENVPGVLSSNRGRDFGSFLGALGNIGYGFAYRVLDAQYFGVPQRRRRVFVVAHSSGDSRRAAEVLFEPESLHRNSTEVFRKRQEVAGKVTASIASCSSAKRLSVNTLTTNDIHTTGIDVKLFVMADGQSNAAISTNGIAPTLNSSMENPIVAFVLDTPKKSHCLLAGGGQRYDPEFETLIPVAHAFKIRGVGHYTGANGGVAKPGTGGSGYMGQDEKAYTIATTQDQQIMHGMAVRRLTPTECERLQGFPDGWTNIQTDTPDGPRYKALGNSMAVPVMHWIGKRINELC